MNVLVPALFAMGILLAGLAGYCLVVVVVWKREKKQLHKLLLWPEDDDPQDGETPQEQNRGVQYMKQLTQNIFCGATKPILPRIRKGKAVQTQTGKWFMEHANWAGCAHCVSASAFCEAAIRLSLLGGICGALIGLVFSNVFALCLGITGLAIGYAFPFFAIRHLIKERALEAELHLSEMLQIVELGLRSGLTFDRSFALYGVYFDNGFSRSCAKAYRKWALGLSTRDEALQALAASYKYEALTRVVQSVLRSLRFGSSLAPILEDASMQARASYRARLEERVAKAPVKMMLPTGTLILPAMLLLVLGPVLLELINGF